MRLGWGVGGVVEWGGGANPIRSSDRLYANT